MQELKKWWVAIAAGPMNYALRGTLERDSWPNNNGKMFGFMIGRVDGQ